MTKPRAEEHFQLNTEVNTLLAIAPEAVREVLGAEAIAQLAALQQREDIAMERISKSEHTQSVAEFDAQRDSLYMAIRLKVQAYSYSTQPDQLQAAADIQVVLDHYGDFRRKPYNEESAIVYNFVQALRERSAAMLTLGLEQWVAELEAANNGVVQRMADRSDARAAVQLEDVRAVRAEFNAAYQRMLTLIEAAIVLNGEAPYADFVNKLNERLQYYKTTLAHRRTVSKTRREKLATSDQ